MKRKNFIERFIDLYLSDISLKEIELLIKQESAEVYGYFSKDSNENTESKSKIKRILILIRNLFNTFLIKLPPSRRIFYLVALFFFLAGYINLNWFYLIFSFLILNTLLVFELFDKLTLKDELTIAKKIQKKLIPENYPKINGYEISSAYQSAKEISGDYYDFIENSDRTFIFVGDISGKGIPAALYMVRVQAIIRSLVSFYHNVKDLLVGLKNTFSNNLETGFFLTVIFASIEKDGQIKICRAGHNPPLLYKASTNEFLEIQPKGLGIGFSDRGMFEKTLEVAELDLEKDDILFLYTDGVVEAMNKYKNQFSLQKVKRVIELNADKSAEIIVDKLKQNITKFRGDAIIHDDLTMVLLKKI